jgi:hypothetical protein
MQANFREANRHFEPVDHSHEEVRRGMHWYRQVMGQLNWLAGTRVEIGVAVAILSRVILTHCKAHDDAIVHLFGYLKNTADMGMTYGTAPLEPSTLQVYTDAEFGSDRTSGRSQGGYIIRCKQGIIACKAFAMKCVALHTQEAEYIAASEGVKEALCIRNLQEEMIANMPDDPIQLWEDNTSCIQLIKDEDIAKGARHISVRYHFIRDLYNKGKLAVSYIPTCEQLADLFTKPLGYRIFSVLRDLIGMRRTKKSIYTYNWKRVGNFWENNIT